MENEQLDPVHKQKIESHYKRMIEESRKISLRLALVSPKMAADLLKTNKGNRRLSQTRIARYTRIINNGDWDINGQAILVDENDDLIDGQHRLESIVAGGIAAPLLIIRGVKRKTFKSLDTGGPRNLADVLSIKKEKYTTTLAAALGWLWKYEHGVMLGVNAAEKPTHAELDGFLQKHPAMREAVPFVLDRCKHKIHQPGPFSFLYYVCSKSNPVKADEFFDQVMNQIGLQKGSAAFMLHQRLLDEAASKRKLPQAEKIAIIIKAWNAHMTGNVPKQLKFTRGGDAPEAFPTIL